MNKISLDANAVIDLCYRFYPFHTFEPLWRELDLFFKGSYELYICRSVYNEVDNYIDNHKFDKQIFDDFMNQYNIEIIDIDQFSEQLLSLQKTLLAYPASCKSKHVTETSAVPDAHLIALASYLGGNSIVLTGEQGAPRFDWNNSSAARNSGGLKIPNICDKVKVKCMNWVKFFDHIGLIL